jgi:hypothetical protein
VRKTISRLADRLGDIMATMFTMATLLLVPHAAVRAIIGQTLHQWIPMSWIVLHVALIVLTLIIGLACYALAAMLTPARPEAY